MNNTYSFIESVAGRNNSPLMLTKVTNENGSYGGYVEQELDMEEYKKMIANPLSMGITEGIIFLTFYHLYTYL